MIALTRLTRWLARPADTPRHTGLRVELLEGREVPALVSVGDITVGNNPLGLALADFNGDNTPDLVSVNYDPLSLLGGTVSVLPGTGTGTFGGGVNLTVGATPVGVAVGDFNADGKLDLAVTNSGGNSVSLLLNSGTGGAIALTPGGTLPVGLTPAGVLSGDFDGDGKLDLAVANRGAGTLSLLRGNGNGTFQPAVAVTVGGTPSRLAAADFDSDGKLDLAVTTPATNAVNVLRNTSISGAISFAPAQSFAVGGGPFALAVGDFNGDAKADLAVTNNGNVSVLGVGLGNTVGVLLNTSSGAGSINFGTQVAFGTGTGPTDVVAADLNVDGKLDLAAANRTSGTVSVLTGNGDGTFQAKVDTAVGIGPLGLAVGDLNLNTVPDVVVGLLGDLLVPIGNTVKSLLNDALPGSPPISPPPGPPPVSPPPVSPPPGSPPVSPPVSPPLVSPPVSPPASPPPGSPPVSPPPGVNVDVEPGVIAVGASAGGGPRVTVFNPDGTVRFDFYAYDPSFTGGVSVSLADVNGDGVADIVTAAGPGGGPHVKVFDGRTLALLQSFYAYDPSFTGGVSVATGDVSGDGVADIVTGALAGGGPHVKAFDGKTGALLQSFYAHDAGFTGGVNVLVSDLTGDGVNDVIVGEASGGSRVRVYDGATRQLVQTLSPFGSFTGGARLAATDLNGDGVEDILVGSGPGGGSRYEAWAVDGTRLFTRSTFDGFDGGVNLG